MKRKLLLLAAFLVLGTTCPAINSFFFVTSLPRPLLDLDMQNAASVTLVGSNITQWDDQSGNGNNVTQATMANQPTYSATALNGHPAAVFSYTQLLEKASATLPSGPATIAVVGQQTASADSNSSIFFYMAGAYVGADSLSANSVTAFTGQVLRASTWSSPIQDISVFNGAGSKLIVGGSIVASGPLDPVGSAVAGEVLIGNNDTASGQGVHGYIGRIIVYPAALDNAQLAQLHYNLLREWGF